MYFAYEYNWTISYSHEAAVDQKSNVNARPLDPLSHHEYATLIMTQNR